MRCPECVKLNQKSKVYQTGFATITGSSVPFYWDEDGNAVHSVEHPNKYKCSNDHAWESALSFTSF